MGSQAVVPATPTIDQKQVTEMNQSVQQLVAMAQEFKVLADNDDYLASGTLLENIAAKEKFVTEFFEKPASAAHALHKWITSMRGAATAPLQQAADIIKNSRKNWRAELERQRLEKEAAEREKAREEAETAALNHAAELEASGETEAANFILERAATAPAPTVVVTSEVPKQSGHYVRKVWKYRIVDASLIKREFLMPNESDIKDLVEKLGPTAVTVIGGIEVYPDEVESVRGKK